MGSFKLTIREVLESSCFNGAEVIAGHKGLDRIVRWVHIMEVTQVGTLLNGNELILSTGIGWGNDQKRTSIQYLKQLIAANVSGLCVEIVKYASEIPQEMIRLADEEQFPLIVFHKEVRFIDITQMIHTRLMNNQYKILSDLEDFSRKLGQTLLMPNAFKRVLSLLHNHLNVQVLYLSKSKDEVIFVPKQNEIEQKRLLKLMEEESEYNRVNQSKTFPDSKQSCASQAIQALGHKFADLIIFSKGGAVTDYESLVLERCATAISQDLLRLFYIDEQQKYKEKQWLHEWLRGEHEKEEIQQHLAAINPILKPKGAVVCVCRMEESLEESTYSYYQAFFKNIFQNHGMLLFSIIESKNLIFILINLSEESWKTRVSKALNQIRETDLFKRCPKEHPIFGVGKYTEDLHRLPDSFLSAKESLQIQKKVSMPHEIFYENLHIYRLVSILNKQGDLFEYINEYIGPVIMHDQKHNSELLNTLTILLESNGSKKEAAKRLYIVRQTLYHRLEKLKELLGEDYMEPTKRAAIEFSLYAYRYLSSTNQTSNVKTTAIQ